MMRHILWYLLVLLSVASASAADRYALVVANGSYESAPLSNPTVDAALVKQALDSIGFQTTVVQNVTIDEFERSLQTFSERAKGAEVVLFYYAGHGFAVSDRGGPRNFLMGVDADVTTTSERALRSHGMPLDDIISTLSAGGAATLIFVDACRNDPSIKRAVGNQGRSAVPIDRTVGENVLVGLSTRLGEVAADGEPGKGSPFARAFVANIVKSGIRVDDAFTQARLSVEKETQQRQRPDIGRYDLVSPLVLVPLRSSDVSSDLATEGETAAYNSAMAVGSCGALDAFIRRYKESFFADLAREQKIQKCLPSPGDPQNNTGLADNGAMSTAISGDKFTQRMTAQGTEIEAGASTVVGENSIATMRKSPLFGKQEVGTLPVKPEGAVSMNPFEGKQRVKTVRVKPDGTLVNE